MDKQSNGSLRKKIMEEMTADYSSALEKHFDLAKQLIRITKEGKVDVLYKNKLTGTESVLLYLIGKLYAKEAGFAPTSDVGNKELMDELGVPKGSVLPWLKQLRDTNQIMQVKAGKYTNHVIALNIVEKILTGIEKKLSKLG